jgi:NAD(P)-dependent dehydrogenase (short-subunit alcohol dehydrogenase family)
MGKPIERIDAVVTSSPASKIAPELADALAGAEGERKVLLATTTDGIRVMNVELVGDAAPEWRTEPIAQYGDVQTLVETLSTADVAPRLWVNDFSTVDEGVPADELDIDRWRAILDSTVTVTFRCCQAAGRVMRGQRTGVIVNLITPDAFVASAGYAATCAAMAGTVMVTKTLALEWASGGVRVVALAGPGPTRLGPTRRTPLKRRGSPQDLAEAVAFVAGADAAYITGEVVSVDGGWANYSIF